VLIDSNELIGKALGSSTLQRLIGRGGMGAVYLARQERPRRTVAVKVLMPSMITEQKSRAEFLTRFRREADAIAALDHVNIVPIYEYGEQEDIAYLVMPYIPGGTLRDVIEQRHILPLAEVIPIIEQAAAALDSAHKQNIIHRDLKPGNMLFHADGRLLLADFGLAKVLSNAGESSKKTELTSIGTIIGTPEYLSPEQGTGKDLDYRTDVYSLGVVLYHMLAGRVPFTGATPVAIALKHALEAPPPLKTFNPNISPVVEAVVMKALAKDPDQRYSSAGELASALREAAKEEGARTKLQEARTVVTRLETTPAAPEESATQPDLTSTEEPGTPAKAPETPPNIDPAPLRLKEKQSEQTVKEPVNPEVERIERYKTQISDGPHADLTEATPRVDPYAPRPGVYPPDTDHIYERSGQGQRLQPPERALVVRQNVAEIRSPIRSPEKRRGLQPVAMMLLGSLLTLVIIVGGLGLYTQVFTKKTLSTLHPNGTALVTPKAHVTATTGPVVLPKAMVPPPGTPLPGVGGMPTLGTLLYGTATPGSTCDKQGGQWSDSSNAQVSCNNQGLTMSNNRQDVLAGSFLEKLTPGKSMPNNYLLQVNVNIHSGSTGNFGVFIDEQPGQQQQAAYSVLLTPPNSWSFYTYQNGSSNQLAGPIPTQSQLQGTITVGVLAINGTYVLFVNGQQQGYAQSDTYTNGNVGLAVGAGAQVSFKNLEVYPVI
jgi:serine/threonine protein kinase